MCFGGGGEGVSGKDQITQGQMAKTSGMLQRDHKKRWKHGVEKGVMDYLEDSSTIDAAAESGAANATQQMGIASAMQENAMARTGMQLTPEQRAAMKAKQDLAGATLVTGEANRARAGEVALKQSVRNPMMDMGRGSLQQGMGMFSSASNMEQQRGQANAVAKEQERQQTGQAVATVAAMMMMSDKKKKTNISKMDTNSALDDVRGMKLKHWRYKDGVGPDTEMHRGPMAQDAPDSITNNEKTMINVHDELQLGMGAIQELAKKVDRIERRMSA